MSMQGTTAQERAPRGAKEELSSGDASDTETENPSGPSNEPDCGCEDTSRVNLENLRVLIVDDSQFSRRIVREGLSMAGVRNLMEAKDAVEAINVLKNQSIDIVVTDYEMPFISGVEFTRMVRRGQEVPNASVPIVIMSSHTERYRIQEAVAAGISEYVVKPFSPDRLLKHMIRAINCPPEVLQKVS